MRAQWRFWLCMALMVGASTIMLSAKSDISPPPAAGDTFVPLPTTPEDIPVPLIKIDDKGFAWLNGREVKVRVVTGQGLTKPLVYPLYAPKAVEIERESIGKNGEKVSAKVKVVVADLLENATMRQAVIPQALHNTLPYRVVSPESNKVTVGLFVDVPHGKGNPVFLGEAFLNRRDGQLTQELEFTIDPDCTYLLSQPAKQFSLEFKEDYIGQFRQTDLQVSVNQSVTAIQEFRNTIQRGSKPDQKVAFVAFGGGVSQDTGLKRQLHAATEVQFLHRRDAVLNPSLLDRFFNDIVKPELVAQRRTFDPQKNSDETFTYFLGNGMSVQGTVGQFNKVDLRDRIELERLMESSKTWDKSSKLFTGLGFKVEAGFLGIGGKGEGNVEFKLDKNDIGAESSKNYSKDVRDLFQIAEGKLPVVALDVAQLQKAEQEAIQALNHVLGTFTVGRRTLTHQISFQSLPASDAKLPAMQTDVEKELSEIRKKVEELEASKPFNGSVRIWHVNEGAAWATMLTPPHPGASPPRVFKKWIEFGPEARFRSAPRVSLGLSSIEAVPARASVKVIRTTEKGFEVEIAVWHDTVLCELDFSYVAIPK